MGELNLDELEREARRALAARNLTPCQYDDQTNIIALIAHIRELQPDAARYQHVRAHGMPKLCPAGFYYHDGVLHPTAEAAIDAACGGEHG